MSITIIIDGIEEVMQTLGRVESIRILRPPMERGVARLAADMANYPPQRPNSSYVRTGTLGRRWTTKVTTTGDGLEGRVGNNTEYAPLVQSQRFQMRIHRGLWQTDQQVVNRDTPLIIEDFERAIRQAISGR